MAAFNMNQGRSVIEERHEEMAARDLRGWRGRTVTVHCPARETEAERKARHARETGTSSRMWR